MVILTFRERKNNRMWARPLATYAGVVAFGLGLLLMAGPRTPWVAAGDWPQILGPYRNGKADQEQLANAWPAGGPRTLWQRKVGSGYAGVAVVGQRGVLFHREKDESVAEAFDAAKGTQLWRVSFPTRYSSAIAPDDGPRCVPIIDHGYVYLFGAEGDLHCVALDTGKVRWSRDAYREFNGQEGYFGAGSTPVVVDDKLLVNVGGRGAGLVAFSTATGKTIWQATDEAASYSSPTVTALDGRRQVIFVTRLNVVAVDPDNGKVQYRFPFGQRGPTVNAATPLVLGDHLFISASYGIGAQYVSIATVSPKIVWESDDVMSSQYTTCVEKDGFLYGLDGRQDGPPANLRCINPQTGKVVWTKDSFGTGNIILADNKLVIIKTEGELVLAEASPAGYKELATTALFSSTVQALPALSSGLLYVRDTATLKCIDLRK